jgi:uracil-DNA glycosylase
VEALHPVNYLFQKSKICRPYPPGVKEIGEILRGTAFFPGASGLWSTEPGKPLPPMPIGGVMVLGHNFDTEAGFNRTRASSTESEVSSSTTWRNLLPLPDEIAIPKGACFFTNAYMGLIVGPSAEGKFPGAHYPGFVKRWQEFLAEQIKAIQPKLILTLGQWVPPFLADLSPDLRFWRAPIGSQKKLQTLDSANRSLIYPVRFPSIAEPTVVLALTHPSRYHANVVRRRSGDLKGADAEKALLREAWSKYQEISR